MQFKNIRTGDMVSLSDGLTIGRHPKNGYVLDEGGVSRYHAKIEWRKDCFFLVDLNSSNGCFANGILKKEICLSEEMLVGIGDVQLEFFIARHNAKSDPVQIKAKEENRIVGRRAILEEESVSRIGDISQQSFGVRFLLYLLAVFVMYGVFVLVRYAGTLL